MRRGSLLWASLLLFTFLLYSQQADAVPCNVTADCSSFDTDCADGTCVMSVCVSVPKMDGLVCSPTDLCFILGQCLTGNCIGTIPKPCNDFNPCTADSCLSPLGTCINDPGPVNGDSCDDGNACTGDDKCDAGVCVGTPADCTGLDDQCNDGICNSVSGDCEAVPKADSLVCNLPFPCIENTTCTAGICGGFPKDCNDDNECTTDVCIADQENPDIGVCFNFWNTIFCRTSDPCFINNQCFEGQCVGNSFDCTEFDSECTDGDCIPIYDPPMFPPPVPFPPPPPPPSNGTNGTKRYSPQQPLVLTPLQEILHFNPGAFSNLAHLHRTKKREFHKPDRLIRSPVHNYARTDICQVPQPGVINPLCDLDWMDLETQNGTVVGCTTFDTSVCDTALELLSPGASFCRQARCRTGDGLPFPQGRCQWRCINDDGDDDPVLCNVGDPCLEWGVCWQGSCAIECVIDDPACNGTVIPPDYGFPPGAFTPVCIETITPDGTPCTGTNPCITGYQCITGVCFGTQIFDCDDGIDCTLDFCVDAPLNMGGGCQNVPQNNLCNDGINCTVDTCQALLPMDGGCVFTPDNAACPPAPPGSECIESVCSDFAGCVLLFQDSLCSNAITCDGLETCNNQTGLCEDAPDLDCEDNNECTICECVEPTGCICNPVMQGTSCVNITNLCYTDGQCIGSVCVGTTPTDCSAYDTLCGQGICNSTSGACFTELFPADTPCDDVTVCNGRELCDVVGICQPGVPLDCANPNQCIITSCHPVDGCQEQQSVGPCSNGDPCITGELCDGQGNCVGGISTDCSFLDQQCMIGQCNPFTGVCGLVPGNEGSPCDDGSTCAIREECQAGLCVAMETLDCDDRNPCTVDSCVEPTGCLNVVVSDGTPCDDPNLCNGDRFCTAGTCDPGTPVDCPLSPDICIRFLCNPDTGVCDQIGLPADACGDCGGDVLDPALCQVVPTGIIVFVVIVGVLMVIAILFLARACCNPMHVMNNANEPELRRETVWHKEGAGFVQSKISDGLKFSFPSSYSTKRRRRRTRNRRGVELTSSDIDIDPLLGK
jgi:hypothetical protein